MCRIWLAVMILALATAAPVSAHALGAECKIRNGRLELEAYFSDNTPAQGAKVIIEDSAKIVLTEGKTDHQGKWSFPVPNPGEYSVIVDAGDGHRVVQPLVVPANPTTVSVVAAGPSRTEFTSFPWLRVAFGFMLIALFAICGRECLRRTRLRLSSDQAHNREK